ncbi:MAG: hypothetical protein BWK80_36165 [Desulfobacteraceae bacterium IS3]|nr:MAG: hypothetical protein BWK80_36165 [Desulfobacteraceae bacterium IS3]
MAYESLEDIAFDESDKNLFQIDDLRLKADAIKYSILPKLHILTHHAILKIKEIYDIDVLEDYENLLLRMDGRIYSFDGIAYPFGELCSENWYSCPKDIKQSENGIHVHIARHIYDGKSRE